MSLKKIKSIVEHANSDEINIKKAISEEYLAISDYLKFAEESTDSRVKKVLLDIAKEEEIHVGELKKLLEIIGVSDEDDEIQGAKEVEDTLRGEHS